MGESPPSLDDVTVRHLQERIQEFNLERGWVAQHSVRSLSEAIVVESAELLELSLWEVHAEDRREALKDEMADVGIYLLSLANCIGVDMGAVIINKMESNEGRFPAS